MTLPYTNLTTNGQNSDLNQIAQICCQQNKERFLFIDIKFVLVTSQRSLNSYINQEMKSIYSYLWRSGGITSFSEIPFCNAWNAITENNNEDQETLNADSYIGRLIIYKRIMDATPITFNSNENQSTLLHSNAFHFLWGYVAQLDWQMRSQRLLFPSPVVSINNDKTHISVSDRIDSQSWWGRMNFSLCIIVLLAAQKALNILPNTTLKGKYMSTVTAYTPAIAAWERTFDKYKQANGTFDAVEFDSYRKHIWEAHAASLEIAMRINEPYYNLLPTDERIISLGWCRMVEFFVAARWRTDLQGLQEQGAGYLPQSILFDKSDQYVLTSATQSSDTCTDNDTDSPSIQHIVALVDDDPVSSRRAQLTLQTLLTKGKETIQQSKNNLKFLIICTKRYITRIRFPKILRALSLREPWYWWKYTGVVVYWWIRGIFTTEK